MFEGLGCSLSPIQNMKIPAVKPGSLIIASLVAWALLFLRQYVHVGVLGLLERVPPIVPAAVAALALAGLLRAALPRRLKTPLLLAGLLTTAAGLVLVGIREESPSLKNEWRAREEREISSVLDAVGKRVETLVGLSASIGEASGDFLRKNTPASGADSVGVRLNAFQTLDALSERITKGNLLPAGTEIGIQLFDADGNRRAWAGWPQSLDARDRRFVSSGTELIYSRQISLYRMLTHVMPVYAEGDSAASPEAATEKRARLGSVLVDMPLEVNYRVNNKFLKSASLADEFARRAAADVQFEYVPVVPGLTEGSTGARGRVTLERQGGVEGSDAEGLSGRAIVRMPQGNTVFGVSVDGRPLAHFIQSRNDRISLVSNLAILVAMLIYFGMSLQSFPASRRGPGRVLMALYLLAGVTLVRYSLVWFQPDFLTTKIKVFEPAVFATPMLGGLMRSAGDLLLTSLFFVAALYGVLKISRGETRRGEKAEYVGWFDLLKGLFAAAVSIAVYILAKRFIGSVVTNANPRLVGETMKIFEPEVIVLHLSAFLMVAGIFLAGMICVWGVYRAGGRAKSSRASAVAAVAIVGVSLVFMRLDMAAISLLALFFAIVAPRVVQRGDLVSIVTGAFCFVIIVSAAAYVFFDQEYQGLRRSFIQEKTVEVTHPSDNWKVFILEDILENFSQNPSLRRSLMDAEASNIPRLAFDLWAGSPLSLLGYSCAIHVFDQADSLVSRFSVEMPYRLRPDEANERLETPSSQEWAVLDLTTETPQGAVRFYRGIVNLDDYVVDDKGFATHVAVGKIVVDVPFFFENLAWAARTGPQTPEVLRNVQEGGIAPRLEETEPILLARVRGTRVLDSSGEALPVGYAFDAQTLERAALLEWPLLETSGATYRIFTQNTDTPEMLLVAGFAVPSLVQHVLRWSSILSLYFFFTVAFIVVLIVLKRLPLLKPVLPTLAPGREFGFQQKLLGSFLLVALLPAVILGVFSVRMIKERFVHENRNEALYRTFSASKSLNNLLVEDLNTLLDDYDVTAILKGDVPPRWRYDDKRRVRVLVVTSPPAADEAGAGRPDMGLIGRGGIRGGGVTGGEEQWLTERGGAAGLLDRVSPGQIFMHDVEGKPYLGVISDPFSILVRGQKETCVIYHARLVDAELLGEVSDQISADVSLFEGGELVATSREGLLSGGFISSTMNANAFVKVSMMGVDHALATEKAGSYRYQVAYVPIPSLGLSGRAAIGVPLLFRPESYSVEVEKARSVVFSIFALLSAATIGLGLLLARGIFEPLRGLLEGTKRIARGDFSFKLPGKRRDEIGTVVEAFNEMTHQVSRSQAALEERRKYLEIILVNIGTGVVSTDAANRISAVNNAAERILGMRSEDLLGKTTEELTGGGILPDFFVAPASEPGPVSEPAGPAGDESRESAAVSSEIDIVTDGHKRTIRYMRTQLSTDGRHLGTVFVFEDITELINSKKLSAWVEMARQIAHEIKNPLTPIKLSTQFMVRAHLEKSEDFDKIFRESSDTIMQQVDVLRNIASEFSSYGRLQHLYLSPHRVIPLVEDIVSPYKRNTTGVVVTLETSDRDLRAVIDPEAVRKICTNLIENAMEAMSGGGGALRISCGEAAYDHRPMVRVLFEDTGPGLSEDVKARLFEPYFSTKTTGTGLGLAICRSLSREMDGEVTVANLPGGRGVQAALYLKPA